MREVRMEIQSRIPFDRILNPNEESANKTIHPTVCPSIFEFKLPFPPWMSYTFCKK